jgi:hypothetical protein
MFFNGFSYGPDVVDNGDCVVMKKIGDGNNHKTIKDEYT